MPSTASRSTRRIERLWTWLVRGRDESQGPDSRRSIDGSPGFDFGLAGLFRFLAGGLRTTSAFCRRRAAPRRQDVLPEGIQSRPRLLVLCTVLLVCLIAIVIGWARRSQ